MYLVLMIGDCCLVVEWIGWEFGFLDVEINVEFLFEDKVRLVVVFVEKG